MITSSITTCSMEGHRRCTHVSDQFSLSYAFHAHDPPSINVCIDASHPRSIDREDGEDSSRTTRRSTMVALTSQGFALAPTATRSALAPRGAWTRCDDDRVRAFGRIRWRGRRRRSTRGETTTTTTRPRRDAGAIRDGDTRSGRTGDEDAFVARATMGRARASAETRCILCVHRRPSRARVRRVARGRRDATRTTDG